jgi:hypothetical protein
LAAWCIILASTLAALTAPSIASAQQKVLLERSASYALDNKFRAFTVPVLDNQNRVKYYDVTVTLTVNAQGVLGTTAQVAAITSPIVTSMVITPGTYRASDGTTCIVTNINTATSRIQSTFACARTGTTVEFAVATGPVAAGHPFLAKLTDVGINNLVDVNSKTWGVIFNPVTVATSITACNSISASSVVGAITDGRIVQLSVYNGSAAYKCGFQLIKQ